MARKAHNQSAAMPQARFPKHKADDAYAAHAALIRAEQSQPSLAQNEYWRALRDAAFARFKAALEAI